MSLSEITLGRFEKRFFYGNSGAETVDASIKLAIWHTKRQMNIDRQLIDRVFGY